MRHKVGTVTLGLTMIIIGILCLARLVFPAIDLIWIIRLWPIIFITLGVEILLAIRNCGVEFVYDRVGIVLTFILTFFAMGIGVFAQMLEHCTTFYIN